MHADLIVTPRLQEPPLRWAGARTRLARAILPHLGHGYRLVEPFVGSAAVWLNSDYAHALLADNNPHLIDFYGVAQAVPEELLTLARRHFESEEAWTARGFVARCRQFGHERDPLVRAALLLYITHFGLSGLLRFDEAGRVTTPFGGRAVRPTLPVAAIHAFAAQVRQTTAEFRTQDFRETFARLEPSDVVYCDPGPLNAHPATDRGPYAPNPGTCTEQDHYDLVACAREAAARGIPVAVSIRDTGRARAIHQQATEIVPIAVPPVLERRTFPASHAELLALYR